MCYREAPRLKAEGAVCYRVAPRLQVAGAVGRYRVAPPRPQEGPQGGEALPAAAYVLRWTPWRMTRWGLAPEGGLGPRLASRLVPGWRRWSK